MPPPEPCSLRLSWRNRVVCGAGRDASSRANFADALRTKSLETGRISLLLAKIRLYSAPSHTETWLKRPSGGSRAIRLACSHVSARNQPENLNDGATRFHDASAA